MDNCQSSNISQKIINTTSDDFVASNQRGVFNQLGNNSCRSKSIKSAENRISTNVKNNTQSMLINMHRTLNIPPADYRISPVSGGQGPIYNFLAPSEYLNDTLGSDPYNKFEQLIYYFSNLYPLSNPEKWRQMGMNGLLEYYVKKLNFWYTFNTAWGVAPMPVVFDQRVVDKWQKNTFYQAGTVIQSAITGCNWDIDSKGNPFYYAARKNNAPTTNPIVSDPEVTYTRKDGTTVILRTVARSQEYWQLILGTKIEVTSWGWNPYPFGIYAQGPFHGTGNFLSIPKRSAIGTSHWDIIWQNRAPTATDERIWSEIFNHELRRLVGGRIFTGIIPQSTNHWDITPQVFIKRSNGVYVLDNIWAQYGGYTPILVSYFCFICGGFGGIGDQWKGIDGPFLNSFQNATGNWLAGKMYTPFFIESNTNGVLTYTMPEDQSIPEGLTIPARSSKTFWDVFRHFFIDYIIKWDINWAIEMWRYPLFWDGNTPPTYTNSGPCVNNPCDDFMMAMVTGNFDVMKYSLWGPSIVDSKLSKYSNNPLKWSHVLLQDGTIVNASSGQKGFPTGLLTNENSTSANIFTIRSQMPNVCGDLCLEFADFRALTPGQLADGSGDQQFWTYIITKYCQNYIFTVDPFNSSNFHSFSDNYAPWLPDTKPLLVRADEDDWDPQENVAIGKSFFGFDVYQGMFTGDLSFTGKRGDKYISFSTYPAAVNDGLISLSNSVKYSDTNDFDVSSVCGDNSTQYIQPVPIGNQSWNLGGNISCYVNKGYQCGYHNPCDTRGYTMAQVGDYYYPFACDSFKTGVVGYQANGYEANIGSCQTRWWLASKGIAWNFDAPLANRIILNHGMRLKNAPKMPNKTNSNKIALITMSVLLLIVIIVLAIWNRYMGKALVISLAVVITVLLVAIIILALIPKNKNEEAADLRLYFNLVYPVVPTQRWQNMSTNQLQKFYCSLHTWYRGVGLPSPVNYMETNNWTDMPPFDLHTKWKDFSTRKNCIIGAPQRSDRYSDNILIGWDNKVGTDLDASPSAILFRGRQLCSVKGGIQQTSFYGPSGNYYMDTYNAFPSVNDPNLEAIKKAKYMECNTTWCPFPTGAYLDWQSGTGIFVRLGNHIDGYSGLDVIRRLGDELLRKDETTVIGILEEIYYQQWQLSGISGMTIDNNGNLVAPATKQCNVCGLYGTVILTMAQYNQIQALANQIQVFWSGTGLTNCADGTFFKAVRAFLGQRFMYYDVVQKIWVANLPVGQGHVDNYPFPMPYFGTFAPSGKGDGKPSINKYAITMPWKYQLYNIAFMTRSFSLDTMFLNEWAISFEELIKTGDFDYSDFIIANKKIGPPTIIKTYDDSITALIGIMDKPCANPIFAKYSRIPNKSLDGPYLTLTDNDNWSSGIWGTGTLPDLKRIQLGCLDRTLYPQNITDLGGMLMPLAGALPQCEAANLEIDAWMTFLGVALGYDSATRIQHWDGNKSLTADFEICHFRIIVPGNLVDDTVSANIYEIWKTAFTKQDEDTEPWLIMADPFSLNKQLYPDVVQSIYNGPVDDVVQSLTWCRPPWIGYNEQNSLYGAPLETTATWMVTQRLSYIPITAEDIGLSSSYPEYNKYIWNFFRNNYNV